MRIQTPKVDGDWLYKDINEENRWFTKEACLRDTDPNLPECTDEKKREWEEEHKLQPEPEPEDVEQENAE